MEVPLTKRILDEALKLKEDQRLVVSYKTDVEIDLLYRHLIRRQARLIGTEGMGEYEQVIFKKDTPHAIELRRSLPSVSTQTGNKHPQKIEL